MMKVKLFLSGITRPNITISSLNFVALFSAILLLLSARFRYIDIPVYLYVSKFLLAYILIFLTSTLFTFRPIILKIYSIQCIVISSLILYYQCRYGFVINQELLLSVFETNANEAAIVLSDIGLYILIPILLIIAHITFKKITIIQSNRKIYLFCIIIQLLIVGIFYFGNYSFTRKFIKEYGNTIEPFYFYGETGKFIRDQVRYRDIEPNDTLYKDIKPILTQGNVNVVVVVGESARAKSFSLNGYTRRTNPLLGQQKNLVSFRNTMSCGTSTSFSVPCILSRQGRDTGFELPLREPSLINVFKRFGFNAYFYSRQDTKHNKAIYNICKEADICEYNIKGYDSKLIEKLKEVINRNGKNLIVLHTNGSHFLYHRQYPKEFEQFKPVCTKKAYECKKEEAINAYDNSILHTDFVLNEMIKSLKNTNSILFYTSDHGESIGENNRYGHASLYKIAPKEQINVPFMIWLSDSFITHNPQSINILQANPDIPTNHNNVFHSVVGCLDSHSSQSIIDNNSNLCNNHQSK